MIQPMLPALAAVAPCLNSLFGCYTPNSNAVITLTYGTLAILAIVGFIIGFAGTIIFVLYKRSYGIITMIMQPIGLSYKRTYYRKQKDTCKEFRHNGYTHVIDMTKTAWTDDCNRPVLVYIYDEVMPLTVPQTNERLQTKIRKLQPMRLEMKKRGGNPADAFDLLFAQKIFEAFATAARRVQKTSKASLAFMGVIAIMLGVIGYLMGSAFPAFHLAPTVAHIANTSTSTTSTALPPNVANGAG